MHRRRTDLLSLLAPFAGAVVLALFAVGMGTAWARADSGETIAAPPVLPAMRAAAAVTVDTQFIGGYAKGTFVAALETVAGDLSPAEREMIGRHLDKIFLPVLNQQGMPNGGRLRLAYERTRRPDGTTRAIQVLAAEAAVGGSLHTVFLYDHGDRPGYYDDWGHSLDPVPWAGPLSSMRVTSTFTSARFHPILRRLLPHLGVDLAAAYGTPVRAAADGSVSWAGPKGGYGNLVEITHPNGYATRYGHLSSVAQLRPGSLVRQGDVIGWVGATGLATGPHLHYEVRRKGVPVDPLVVQPSASSSQEVGYDGGWRQERATLAELLARAPSMVGMGPRD
ncbi:MAG TPA: M23 family metallopeptidase [Longimicrobium sp.]|jgi:murein DD-endopeptidase MepM/ murein hydrolase activator NlpD|nr:M23 family metallopeptidase [Longimicrobium sp.]